MAQALPENLITALDVGSSKISALIAEAGEKMARCVILGTGQRESRGVKRGYIADMRRAPRRAIREAVEQAERIAGTNIEDVLGQLLGGRTGRATSPGWRWSWAAHRVEQDDIDELLACRRATRSIPTGQDGAPRPADAATRSTGSTGVSSPLGLHADRLGVDIHVVARPMARRCATSTLCPRGASGGEARSSPRRSATGHVLPHRRRARAGRRAGRDSARA